MNKKILIVDDDKHVLTLLERFLSKKNYDITTQTSAHEAIQSIAKENFDLIISDLTMSSMNGLELLRYAQKLTYYTPFIIITGYGSIESAVEAVKSGAFEYVIKPFSKEQIIDVVERTIRESEFKAIPKEKDKANIFANIVGKSKKMRDLFRLLERIAATSATVLIQGESGTGKELIAKAVHQLSPRSQNSFVAINCAVLSENLLENELFGHVKGAFTGAVQYKKGLFEVANGGTLFLDEIGDLPAPVQTKLLRVLQEKEFKPLGSNETIKVDVRVIAATNVDLLAAVEEKKFRQDLYYRLAVIPITVPPLRNRKDDVPILAMYFVKKYNQENQKMVKLITLEAMEKLMDYDWKGNVRELENTIERAVALCASDIITPDLLWQNLQDFSLDSIGDLESRSLENYLALDSPDKIPLKEILNKITKEAIIKALEITQGNRSKAANVLGIARASLYQKLKELHLEE